MAVAFFNNNNTTMSFKNIKQQHKNVKTLQSGSTTRRTRSTRGARLVFQVWVKYLSKRLRLCIDACTLPTIWNKMLFRYENDSTAVRTNDCVQVLCPMPLMPCVSRINRERNEDSRCNMKANDKRETAVESLGYSFCCIKIKNRNRMKEEEGRVSEEAQWDGGMRTVVPTLRLAHNIGGELAFGNNKQE